MLKLCTRTRVGSCRKWSLKLSDLNWNRNGSTNFSRTLNFICHEYPLNGSWVATCTPKDGRHDRATLKLRASLKDLEFWHSATIFRRVHMVAKRDYSMSVRPSVCLFFRLPVCPHASACLPLDGFPLNLMLVDIHGNVSGKSICGYSRTKISGTLHEEGMLKQTMAPVTCH